MAGAREARAAAVAGLRRRSSRPLNRMMCRALVIIPRRMYIYLAPTTLEVGNAGREGEFEKRNVVRDENGIKRRYCVATPSIHKIR